MRKRESGEKGLGPGASWSATVYTEQRERTRTVAIGEKLPKRENGLLYEFDVNVISIYSVYFHILW